MRIETLNNTTNGGDGETNLAKFCVVDLAGSEKSATSQGMC
jgi:hypothetical protein